MWDLLGVHCIVAIIHLAGWLKGSYLKVEPFGTKLTPKVKIRFDVQTSHGGCCFGNWRTYRDITRSRSRCNLCFCRNRGVCEWQDTRWFMSSGWLGGEGDVLQSWLITSCSKFCWSWAPRPLTFTCHVVCGMLFSVDWVMFELNMKGTTHYKSTTEERHILRLTGKCMCSRNLGNKVHWLSRDMVLSAGR